MTKAQVVSTVDFVALNVIPDRVVRGHRRPFEIRVIPLGDDRDDNGVFTITSITQGANGAVYVDKHGVVTYKPQGGIKNDSFTVTIQDIEGASSTKTITIAANAKDHDHDDTE